MEVKRDKRGSMPRKVAPGFHGRKLLTLVLLILNWCPPSISLIPNQCIHNITIGETVCCPISPYNGRVCGGPGRGFCQNVDPQIGLVPVVLLRDDRLSWPLRFFSHACQCIGNYFGVSCESCWFGWTGPQCNRRQIRIRKDIHMLSSDQIEIIKDIHVRSQTYPSGFSVLDESTNARSDPLTSPRFIPASVQYYVTFLHRYGSRPTLFENEEECEVYGLLNFSHDGPVFPTWHRYFNLLWERMLANIAKDVYDINDFTMPYWDFIGLKHCDICTNQYFGGPGPRTSQGLRISQDSVFHNYTNYCMEPAEGPVCYGCQIMRRLGPITRDFNSLEFPNQLDLDFAMNLEDYFVPGERDSPECQSFHMALEGFCGRPEADPTLLWMHNKIHRMIDGSMCCTATATNDPIFLVLHNFVDKIFNAWLRLHEPSINELPDVNVRPGHNRNSFIMGLMPLARNSDMFIDSRALGYDFDDTLFGKHAENMMPPLNYGV